MPDTPLSFVDLFSGAGGMSYGFHAHERFVVVGAADAQIGKPSAGVGRLDCNDTYQANMGIEPVETNLATADPGDVYNAMGLTTDPVVLSSCSPCTGLTRANPNNHIVDDARNSLVARSALFAAEFKPKIFLMENARELVTGNHQHHLQKLTRALKKLGYRLRVDVHMLSNFGLPQKRERALVIAVRDDLPLYGLEDLWYGLRVDLKATHVRRAIWDLPAVAAGEAHSDDAMHVSPSMNATTMARLRAVPRDGGSWADLYAAPETRAFMTPGMLDRAEAQKWGSHPDVYGRMWWDRPAPTIKRESSHIGNGRYAHPEQDRQCTVREMGILNGFPTDYEFVGGLSNMYRHIGDAVPPLIAYQLAALTSWILTGVKPSPEDLVLPSTHLTSDDIEILTV